MTTLHATPYNIDVTGFYFTGAMDYETKACMHVDRYGNLVEEFEIQFIDGDAAELFEACGINQTNLNVWFDEIELLQDFEKASLAPQVYFYTVATAAKEIGRGKLIIIGD